jgi:hypothetical protein
VVVLGSICLSDRAADRFQPLLCLMRHGAAGGLEIERDRSEWRGTDVSGNPGPVDDRAGSVEINQPALIKWRVIAALPAMLGCPVGRSHDHIHNNPRHQAKNEIVSVANAIKEAGAGAVLGSQ